MLAHTGRDHPELSPLMLGPGTVIGAATDSPVTALFASPVVLCGAGSP